VRVRVRFFASLADRVGTDVETVDVPAGTDVAGLWNALARKHPGIGDLRWRPMAACDLVYAEWDQKLDGVEEVAFLPPVSGG